MITAIEARELQKQQQFEEYLTKLENAVKEASLRPKPENNSLNVCGVLGTDLIFDRNHESLTSLGSQIDAKLRELGYHVNIDRKNLWFSIRW